MTSMEELLAKLKEFDAQLPELLDAYKLPFRKVIEPLRPFDLIEHMHAGLMVPISRGALLEIIRVLEAEVNRKPIARD